MNVTNATQTSLLRPTTGDVGQKLTVEDVVLQFSAFLAATAFVLLTVDTKAVRVTFDGTDPDATVGTYLPAGTVLWLSKEAATAAKFHQVDAAATVYASPFTN